MLRFTADKVRIYVYGWIVQFSGHPDTKACPLILSCLFPVSAVREGTDVQTSRSITLIMTNKYCIGEFNGRRLCTGLPLDYRLRLWASASASSSILR